MSAGMGKDGASGSVKIASRPVTMSRSMFGKMEKKYGGKAGKGLKLTGKGELFDKNGSSLDKLTGNRVIFENNNCSFSTIYHGYQGGILYHMTETCGIFQNGFVVGDSVECFQDYLVYLNGIKVGIILTCAGEEEGSYYFLYDGQGNVAQLSNRTGDLPWHLLKYDSYGRTTEHLTSDPQGDSGESLYKGYDSGPFGYKTGVRHYDPETGTFLSPDAFKGYMGDPPSQHPYMYCKGNPIKYADPSGYFAYDGGENWWKNNHPILYNALKKVETEATNNTAAWQAFEYSPEAQDYQNKYNVKFKDLIIGNKTKVYYVDAAYFGKVTGPDSFEISKSVEAKPELRIMGTVIHEVTHITPFAKNGSREEEEPCIIQGSFSYYMDKNRPKNRDKFWYFKNMTRAGWRLRSPY